MVNMESWVFVFFRNDGAFKERTGEDFTAAVPFCGSAACVIYVRAHGPTEYVIISCYRVLSSQQVCKVFLCQTCPTF